MGREDDSQTAVPAPRGRRRRALAPVLLAALCAGTAVAGAAPSDIVSGFQSAGAVRLGEATNVRLSATAPVSRTIGLPQAKTAGSSCRLVLELADIRFSAPPSVAYEVYVDLPPGAAPRPGDPHHVGSLTFYGLDGKGTPRGSHAVGQLLDVTAAARASAQRGKLEVTFVPFALVDTNAEAPKASNVAIGRIEVRAVKTQ